MKAFRRRFGIWLWSLVVIVIAPLLPLGAEAARDQAFEIKSDSILLTAAVLGIGFLATSEGYYFRFVYGVATFLSVVLDFRGNSTLAAPPAVSASAASASPDTVHWIFSHPSYILLSALLAQTIERFIWHVVQDRAFPDYADRQHKE